MTRFVIIDLWGPFSSWGSIACGEIRPSMPHPTRSALLGLAAGALGLKRKDKAELSRLNQSLGVGIMVCDPGRQITDYHTVQMPKQRKNANYHTRREELLDNQEGNTMITKRDYRCEAFYSVAFWLTENEAWPQLPDLVKAFQEPVFTPSLGRKSCVLAMPMGPRLVEAETLLKAFEKAKQENSCPFFEENSFKGQSLFWDASKAIDPGVEAAQVLTRRDSPLDRELWLFGQRLECFAGLS